MYLIWIAMYTEKRIEPGQPVGAMNMLSCVLVYTKMENVHRSTAQPV